MNYRSLNKVTIKNQYPLPLIQKTLDCLIEAKIFTKLDLRDIYYRIHIKEVNTQKIAFRTRYSYFEYFVMLFDFYNAPATFQTYINNTLKDLLNITYIVYINNIIIFSSNRIDYIRYIYEVLTRLREYSLYIKLSKYEFNTIKLIFLDY